MKSYLKNIDIWLYLIPTLLTLIGGAVIYSLVYTKDAEGLLIKQGIALGLGIVLMVFFLFYDYRHLKNLAWPLYIFGIILLIIVDFWGSTAGGATRWLQIGSQQIQPSEIFKVVAAIFWANYFSTRIGEIKLKDFAVLAALFGLPLYLVLKQPDLGTALVLVFMMIITIFWLKLSKRQFFVIWVIILLLPVVLYFSMINFSVFGGLLKDYQRARIEVFLDPAKDVLGRGYNVRQAVIAVGSGGIFGKGLGHGSQSQLQFLPKAHTDFIFSGFAEAFGFIGSITLIAAYSFLLIRIIRIGRLAKDNFGLLLAVASAAMIFFQFFENIGMNIGLMPVTGIPLPFLSYGGTAVLTNFLMIAILQSVILRHKKIIF